MNFELFMILGWASPIGLGLFILFVSIAAWFSRKSKKIKD